MSSLEKIVMLVVNLIISSQFANQNPKIKITSPTSQRGKELIDLEFIMLMKVIQMIMKRCLLAQLIMEAKLHNGMLT
eukprot:Seg924.7 transcript_id=Seg924.7/GoldUCD/mRNA.D3Y31 product="hypothetical protein" pseudo=true protein_id=Seg924.7/GoldUCD/D3Y31